ncbi:cyclase [Deinococcus malanensis]|uniref:Cyclase n=1 Tax=Deinococcus malanensis TaxID=1706855 RepID=A0ABQ2ESH1_9DEIO|nr:SRPBCC family protein [Deinococcus malanensis]GGK22884.1 cyclase [Deinococcus malanensis]
MPDHETSVRDLSPQNSSPGERLLVGALGLGLIVLSVGRPGQAGALVATGGALLLAGAAMGRGVGDAMVGIHRTKDDAIAVERGITIGVEPDQLYVFWRNFENLPQFMDHLESVEVQDTEGNRSHWVAKAPAGTHVKWDAEVTEDVAGKRIAWRSLEGSQIWTEGHVEFRPAPGDRGTEVHVALKYRPPGGTMGATIARLMGEEPAVQVGEDLRRLKRMMELGQQPTTEGQSSARKGAVKKAEAKMYDNRRTS